MFEVILIKSQCLIVNSDHELVNHPLFWLCCGIVPYTDSHNYLGHIINSKLKDDPDIMNQTRSPRASPDTKISVMLFKAHCTQICGFPSCSTMFQYSYN